MVTFEIVMEIKILHTQARHAPPLKCYERRLHRHSLYDHSQHLTTTPELLILKLAAHFIPALIQYRTGLNLIFIRHLLRTILQ